jgi:hypothetical protein
VFGVKLRVVSEAEWRGLAEEAEPPLAGHHFGIGEDSLSKLFHI